MAADLLATVLSTYNFNNNIFVEEINMVIPKIFTL